MGYKPTFGLVPGDGVIMLSWSLDHVAHMAAMRGRGSDARRAQSSEHTPYTAALQKDVKGLRVGIPVAALENADPEVVTAFAAAVAALRDSGVTVEEVDTPAAEDFDLAMLMGLVVSRCEAAAYHTAFGERRSLYDTVAVAEQLDEAAHVSAVAYLQAQRAREDLRTRMLAQMQEYDGFLMPTTRGSAQERGG